MEKLGRLPKMWPLDEFLLILNQKTSLSCLLGEVCKVKKKEKQIYLQKSSKIFGYTISPQMLSSFHLFELQVSLSIYDHHFGPSACTYIKYLRIWTQLQTEKLYCLLRCNDTRRKKKEKWSLLTVIIDCSFQGPLSERIQPPWSAQVHVPPKNSGNSLKQNQARNGILKLRKWAALQTCLNSQCHVDNNKGYALAIGLEIEEQKSRKEEHCGARQELKFMSVK